MTDLFKSLVVYVVSRESRELFPLEALGELHLVGAGLAGASLGLGAEPRPGRQLISGRAGDIVGPGQGWNRFGARWCRYRVSPTGVPVV